MKVTFNGVEYRVRFTYSNGKATGRQALQNIHNKRIVTYADIETKVGDQWQVLSAGQSIKNKADVFKKGLGRRLALQVATSGLGNKSLQRTIWSAYFDNHRDGTELMIDSEEGEHAID